MIAFISKIMNLGSSNSKLDLPKRNTNLPCKRVVCTKSTISDQSNLLKQSDVKTSSSKTTRPWNGSCNRLLCSFGESKSKPSGPSQFSFVRKNETKSSLARPSLSVTGVKSVETSSKVQRDCKNDSRAVMTGSKQSNPASLNKVVPPAVVKKPIQNTAGPKDPPMRNPSSKILINQSPKDLPPYNLRKRVEKSQASKDSPAASLKREAHKPEGPKASSLATVKRETHKTEGPKASTVAPVKRETHKTEGPSVATVKRETHKTEGPKASIVAPVKREPQKTEGPKASIVAIPKSESRKTDGPKVSTAAPVKRGIPKPNNLKASQIGIQKREREIPAPSAKKIDTAKTSTPFHDEKNHPSSTQKRPQSDNPVYHIRWEGYDKECELSGHKCMLCDMDLSISPSGNNDESLEDNDYDDEYYDEYQYKPRLLPAVDILSCGHAFHTKCSTSTDFFEDEQSTDPECIFCLSMA